MKRLLVVGNGMVGHRLVETLRARDGGSRYQVIVLGRGGPAGLRPRPSQRLVR